MNDKANDSLTIVRMRNLPDLHIDAKGRPRLQGGRWSKPRMKEYLETHPSWQTLDDLARIVFGCTGQRNRERVSKRIPAQRRYMMNAMETPIVTRYGPSNKIVAIKIYSPTSEEDRVLLKMELDRAREKKELSEKRYDDLVHIFSLPARSVEEVVA